MGIEYYQILFLNLLHLFFSFICSCDRFSNFKPPQTILISTAMIKNTWSSCKCVHMVADRLGFPKTLVLQSLEPVKMSLYMSGAGSSPMEKQTSGWSGFLVMKSPWNQTRKAESRAKEVHEQDPIWGCCLWRRKKALSWGVLVAAALSWQPATQLTPPHRCKGLSSANYLRDLERDFPLELPDRNVCAPAGA